MRPPDERITMRGRKAIDAAHPRTEKVTTRLSKELLDKLAETAADGSRTLSDEMARRLAASYEMEDLFGGSVSYALCRLFVEALEQLRRDTVLTWHRDAFTYKLTGAAVPEIMSYFKPAGVP